MSIVTHKQLDQYLNFYKSEQSAQVYLIYGEDLLINQSLKKLIDLLIPNKMNRFEIETFDESNDNYLKAINSINTFSLSQNGKVVILYNSNLFKFKEREHNIKEKIEKTYKSGDFNKAAELLLDFSSDLNLSYKEFDSPILYTAITNGHKEVWLDKLVKFCKKNSLVIPKKLDDFQIINDTIERGLPEKHRLILISDTVDKKKGLFKIINSKGLIIDCLIPKSRKHSDKMVQDSVLKDVMYKIFSNNGKTIDERTYKILSNMTDFDLNSFSNNLNQLIDYVGERKHITTRDVKNLFKRTKKDPIFDFTNAMAEQNLSNALFYLDSLISNKIHPLQILNGLANSIRKLILAKDFILNDKYKTLNFRQTFSYFKLNTIEAVKNYDMNVKNMLDKWDGFLQSTKNISSKRHGSNLFLLKNNNPYSVYVTILRANKLEKKLLLETIKAINRASKKLKSTNNNPKTILESVVFFMCQS